MNLFKAAIKKSYIVNLVCVVICLSPFCLAYWTSSKAFNSARLTLKVINHASKLTVLRTIPVDDTVFELIVRNDYDRVVTSYAYSFNPSAGYHSVEQSMRPGETSTRLAAIPEPSLPLQPPTLTILAAVCQDNTGDGDLRVVGDLINTQLGEGIQIERVNSLLKKFSWETDHDLPSRLSQLKTDIANLTDPPEAQLSFSFRAAVHDQKKAALEKVEKLERVYLEKGPDGFQVRLNSVMGDYDRRSSSYKAVAAQ
jgi:hypothetical protein